MTHIIIDRRLNTKKKSTVNRKRFLERVKKQTRKAVKDAVREGKISDIASDKEEKVNVPAKDISEPIFHHGDGGTVERVFPGNEEFIKGDRFPRPPEGHGMGKGPGSPDGVGEDSFSFNISKEEFLDIFFEDLELPDLTKTDIATAEETTYRKAGFITDGSPNRLSIIRSMRRAYSRRIALRNPKRKELQKLEEELAALILIPDLDEEQEKRQLELAVEIEHLKKRIKAIPFIDEIDLRYHNYVKEPVPITQAVMFCIMDVSGSMGPWEKEMSKRFFMLLYLFLTRNYEKIELVFIRHHTIAKEVDEDEFFNSRETGGTIVSPAFDLARDIIDDRFPPSRWNIYACQCSDGDNWTADCPSAKTSLESKILPLAQYFAYVEIIPKELGQRVGELWPHYEQIKAGHKNFDMASIRDVADIYPVFRGLFEKRG